MSGENERVLSAIEWRDR